LSGLTVLPPYAVFLFSLVLYRSHRAQVLRHLLKLKKEMFLEGIHSLLTVTSLMSTKGGFQHKGHDARHYRPRPIAEKTMPLQAHSVRTPKPLLMQKQAHKTKRMHSSKQQSSETKEALQRNVMHPLSPLEDAEVTTLVEQELQDTRQSRHSVHDATQSSDPFARSRIGGKLPKSGLFTHQHSNIEANFSDMPTNSAKLSPLPFPRHQSNSLLPKPPGSFILENDYLEDILTKPDLGPRNTGVSPLKQVRFATKTAEEERDWEKEKRALLAEIKQEEEALKQKNNLPAILKQKNALPAVLKKSVTFSQPSGNMLHLTPKVPPLEATAIRPMAQDLKDRVGLMNPKLLDKLQKLDFSGNNDGQEVVLNQIGVDRLYNEVPSGIGINAMHKRKSRAAKI
jgi:hypothetical protein